MIQSHLGQQSRELQGCISLSLYKPIVFLWTTYTSYIKQNWLIEHWDSNTTKSTGTKYFNLANFPLQLKLQGVFCKMVWDTLKKESSYLKTIRKIFALAKLHYNVQEIRYCGPWPDVLAIFFEILWELKFADSNGRSWGSEYHRTSGEQHQSLYHKMWFIKMAHSNFPFFSKSDRT